MNSTTESHVLSEGYTVRFDSAMMYGWFYTRVFHNGYRLAEKSCCTNYKRAMRWARRRVKDHQKALAKPMEEGI